MRNGEEIQDETPSLSSMGDNGNTNMVGAMVDNESIESNAPMDYAQSETEAPVLDSSSELRSINIEPLSSGYKVKVGCQTVAVETSEKLVKMLGIYLKNPREFEKKWYSKDTRNRLDNI